MTLQGDISVDATATPLVIEMEYLTIDIETGIVYWINNYILLLTEGIDFVEVEIESSAGSRFYNHDFAYVNLCTTAPFLIYDDDDYSTSGSLVCVGENNTKSKLTSVDSSSYRVEADTDGDNSYETDLGVFLWSDLMLLGVTCSYNTDCSSSYYCAKAIGDCHGEGVCSDRPLVCDQIFDPVCSCDVKTYSNDCEAAGSDVNVANKGGCI